ncbi:MAG: peroxiredoxin [Deltaproteobacteria bacterium]|nr:peroxiredoxin [Deltaproteobacteria bacterium]MCL5793078.1 peroxiredoxin [Deltaproteobacteria bacterium]
MTSKKPSGKKELKIGDTAPDFTLVSQSGEKVNLKDLIGKKNIVLYFYPRDYTTGCTSEACAFRDSYEAFKQEGAEVIGISSDTKESHTSFASHYKLPFTLLSDNEGKVRKLYGVPKTLGLLPGRVTYIIDQKGIIRHIFSSQFMPKKHIDDALRILRDIGEEGLKKAV